MIETPQESEPKPDTDMDASRPGRMLRRSMIVVGIVIALGLLISFAPMFAVRYYANSILNDLGIDHTGIDTLSINPWTRELRIGPARFGTGKADPAQIGELGLRLSYNPLLKRQVLVEQISLLGIDLYIQRLEDGSLVLNGVPMSHLLPAPEGGGQPEKQDSLWGAGLKTLQLRDSRLVFQDGERGDLKVDVERLTLSDFQTWRPDSPGHFELAATVNDTVLNWSGELRPFAHNIVLDIDSRTEQAELPKVIRFTGPLGLDRQDGTYDVELEYHMTLFDSGRIEGETHGTIAIKDVDYLRQGEFSLKLERATVELDLSFTWSEANDFNLSGELTSSLGPHNVTFGADTQAGASKGRVTLSALDISHAANGALGIELQPDIDLEKVSFSGPIEISLDSLIEVLAMLQSLSANAALSAADTGLSDLAESSVSIPSSDVSVDHLQIIGESMSLQSAAGQVALELDTRTSLSGMQIDVNERRVRITQLQGSLRPLRLQTGDGRMTLDLSGRHALSGANLNGPLGTLDVGSLETSLDKLALQMQSGSIAVQLDASTHGSKLSSVMFAQAHVPEAKFELGEVQATLRQATLDATEGKLRWQASGDSATSGLKAEFAKGEMGAFKLNRAEITAAQANDQLNLAADTVVIDGLDLYVRRSLLQGILTSAGGTPPETAATTAEARPDPTAAGPATQVDTSRIQTLLSRLGYQPGPADGLMGKRTAAAISEFQRSAGLAVDGRLSASLLAALEARAKAPADSTSTTTRKIVATPTSSGVRIGRVALTGEPRIRFHDDIVEPPVKVDTVFKEAEVLQLDTRKSSQRTQIKLAAEINEFTLVKASGWTEGLNQNADLELNAEVENLELATYSPYVVELAGVYLESGQLDLATASKATAGALQGELALGLDNIAFRPLSEKDAARVAGSVGVPLETAVGLLQDSDGHIALNLPIQGTLQTPHVELASAVNKAIGGALKKVFPPTMVASMLSGVAKGGGATFEPIAFAPGSAELDDTGRAYADQLSDFLGEHPKLSLRICGRSTAQDNPPAKATGTPAKGEITPPAETKGPGASEAAQASNTLRELAIERAQKIRNYLVKDRGTNTDQVPECRSTFDSEDSGQPRVEVSL